MKTARYSKDPKTLLVSIATFLEKSNYLCQLTKADIWTDNTVPQIGETYYKFTNNLLIRISFGYKVVNYGSQIKEKLSDIIVCYRDGITEYSLFDNEINRLKCNPKKSNKTNERINNLLKAKQLLPKYEAAKIGAKKPFDSFLINADYSTTFDDLKNKYLVFDIETNGLRKSNDDLLSLSIYDPTTGICYNRFFPLDLQPLILTTYLNGITENDLQDQSHLSQDEVDWLYSFFDLKNRKLLSFSGGNGTFDYSFIQNYCKRHNIIGFDDLRYENIKSMIPRVPFGCEGQLSKDNLCRLFNISGISDTHSSYNDCILEWKLFENLKTKKLFFINEHLYDYSPEYIVPISYLLKYPELSQYANVCLPKIIGMAKKVFELDFPKKALKEIKKFPTNITGITIEHGINTCLAAEKQDNYAFLSQNLAHLKYVASLNSNIQEIPITVEDDGTIKAVVQKDQEYIDEINDVTLLILENIKPLVDYLKNNIFINGKIMTQELSISDDKKVLALCDLSDKNSVVEIKTTRVLLRDKNENGRIKQSYTYQLYYQAKGRKTYIIAMDFDSHYNLKKQCYTLEGLKVSLYKVSFKKVKTLDENEINYYL